MKKSKENLEFKSSFLKEEYRRPLLSLVIIVLLIISALFLVKPKVSEILEARKAIKKEREKLAQLTQKAALLSSLNEVELTQRADLTLRVLPVEKDVPLILSSLKVLAAETGLILESVGVSPGKISTDSAQLTPANTAQGEILPSYAFDLSTQGKTDQIKDFIDRVKQIIPLLEVKTLSLSWGEDDLLSANLTINAFTLALPEKIGPVDKPLPLLTQSEEDILKRIASYRSPLTEEALPFVPAGKENPFAF